MAIVMTHETNFIPSDLARQVIHNLGTAYLLEPDEFLEEICLSLIRIEAKCYCSKTIERELDHLLEREIGVEVCHLFPVKAFLLKDPQYV